MPSRKLADFVRCRDLTCRFPGCDEPAYRCDLDHTIAYPVGPTCASNLGCLCRKHHLLKTFWCWLARQLPDGTIIWTSPQRPDLHHPIRVVGCCFRRCANPPHPSAYRGGGHRRTQPRPGDAAAHTHPSPQTNAKRIDAERKLNDGLVAERNRPPSPVC